MNEHIFFNFEEIVKESVSKSSVKGEKYNF